LDHEEFVKCKACLCARRDQQVNGVNYKETDVYAQTLKAAEGRILLAIATAYGHNMYKTDSKQALLYGDMGYDTRLVAGTKSGRIRTTPSQKHPWNQTSGTEVPYPYFGCDDEEQIRTGQ
jgi:hypothetical protein